MNIQKTVIFLCGILSLLWDTAQSGCSCTSGTTSPDANGDPHYFNVCSDGQQIRAKCPPLTLYVESTAKGNVTNCQATYAGCSETLSGCVPCQYFPWPTKDGSDSATGTDAEVELPSPVKLASMTPPACDAVGPAAPYCDPSYYWNCEKPYATAKLKPCPPGYGFSTRRIIGCVDWFNWNTEDPDTPSSSE
ncbi:uncharacterized protein LOC119647679 [Hermetia illucens]|nr:uncharacterized protein LOC119647679 [Hermetia illucens]